MKRFDCLHLPDNVWVLFKDARETFNECNHLTDKRRKIQIKGSYSSPFAMTVLLVSSVCIPPPDTTAVPCPTLDTAGKRCGTMIDNEGVFRSCLAKLNSDVAQMFFKSCLIDACRFDESIICSDLEVFAFECSLQGVRVSWRNNTRCRMYWGFFFSFKNFNYLNKKRSDERARRTWSEEIPCPLPAPLVLAKIYV